MALITYTDKNTGDQFTAADANEIKNVVNANAASVSANLSNRTFSTTLTAPAGQGEIRFNSLTNPTEIYIHEDDSDGDDYSNSINLLTNGSVLRVTKSSDAEVFMNVLVSSQTDNTGSHTIVCTLLEKKGDWSAENGSEVSVSIDLAPDAELTSDELAGIQGGNSLSGANPVVTQSDIAVSNEPPSLNVRADKIRLPTSKVTQSGEITLTSVSSGAINAFGEVKVVTCDGSNINLSGDFTNYTTIETTAGQTIAIEFVWNSSLAEYMVTVSPPATRASSSIILMSDLFTGATIDTGKWTVTNPSDAVDISQNDTLIFTTTGAGGLSWANNNLTSIFTFGTSDFVCSIDIVSATNYSARQFGIKIQSAAGNTSISLRCRDNGGIDADMYFTDSTGASILAANTEFAGVDPTAKTWRVRHESNTLYWEYWNGSSFTVAHSVGTSGNIDTDLTLVVQCGDNGGDGAGTTIFDNVYISSENYSTQYPT